MKYSSLFVLSVSAIFLVGMLSCGEAEMDVEKRIDNLLGQMTLEEKVDMVSGDTWMDTSSIERLGIPALNMADGPLGVRSWNEMVSPSTASSDSVTALPDSPPVNATAFPAGVALASTWNTDAVEQVGGAIGQQVRNLGRNMLLAPTLNIHRLPQGGRNFESYSEDPYLASRMAVAYIKGVQSHGVIATAKHFAVNNQEYKRHSINVKIDERALHEIYLPTFKAAVEEAGVWAVMSAYNKVNGLSCAANPYLLTDVLKTQWGFKGLVVSDWGGTYETAATANAGLDIEMPGAEGIVRLRKTLAEISHPEADAFVGAQFTRELLMPAISSGQVSESVIDDKVRRILRTMIETGIFDRQETPSKVVDTPEQIAAARTAATQGIVLLKNSDGLLPLLADKVKTIAVIGPNANVARTGGSGSSAVVPNYSVSPLEGIMKLAGSGFQISYALGCTAEGEEEDSSQSNSASLLDEAVKLAASSDVALVFAGYSSATEGESGDRTLDLPAGQDALIQAVVQANKNTAVVINSGGPVLMNRWINQTPAVLMAWYLGQETGNAVAGILFGNVNPSGKLPVTFIKQWEDSPAYGAYPEDNGVAAYKEGIYVGYRYFDTKNVEPLFPFGHGLSYTAFEYSDLQVTPQNAAPGAGIQVSLKVSNSGSRAGAEVVQLYVHDIESSLDRPAKELKAFDRVMLKPGETQTVSFTLDDAAFSFYEPDRKEWVAEPGAFEIQIGASSRDIRLSDRFELTK